MENEESHQGELQEFVDLLFTPLPPDAAREFVKLCREELAGIVADPVAERGDVDEQFDKTFEAAVRLNPSQRRRLITSLVNYEVLLRKRAKRPSDSPTAREVNDHSVAMSKSGTLGRLSTWLSSLRSYSSAVR